LNGFLLFAGLVLLTAAFFQFAHPLMRRLGLLSVAATVFAAGYWLSDNVWVGAGGVAALLLLPWIEILLRIRKLRLPLRKPLRQATPPSQEMFPDLGGVTDSIESSGFEHAADLGWEMDGYRQFLRLFACPEKREEAAITYVEQSQIGFHFASVTSRAADGSVYITWNCPVPSSLKTLPTVHLNRLPGETPFGALLASHETFLARQGLARETLQAVEPDVVRLWVERDMESQIQHNLCEGLLEREDEEHGRYSWRGMLFLWWQVLRDILRLS
jgi:hypothetical protein